MADTDIYSDARILIYVNVDETGEIIEALVGRRVIPDKQFRYFFITDDEETLEDIQRYKVVNYELVRKEA